MSQSDFTIIFQSAATESPEVAELVAVSDDYRQVKEECEEIDALLELSEQIAMPTFWYYSST